MSQHPSTVDQDTQAMRARAVIIGTPATCAMLEQQLDLLPGRPRSIGWIVRTGETDGSCYFGTSDRIIGTIEELERLAREKRFDLALISLPAVMTELVTRVRTTLRRLQIPERFMPTLNDQLAGVGPRTHYDIDPLILLRRPPREIDQKAIRELLGGRRVLITGAGGSIGSELARLVAQYDPAQLVLVERSENALFDIDRQIARVAPNLDRRALLHDIVDARGTFEHFRMLSPDIVFHAAAHKHVPMMESHPSAAVDNNLFGTKSVVDAAHQTGVERFVMISTDKAVHPTSVMGATKRLAELYVQWRHRDSKTAFAMVRFGNVLGSSGSVLEIWARQLAEGGPLTVTDERMTRYFMSIPEAAALVTQSAALVDHESQWGEVFLLDMGDPIRIMDLAKSFIRIHGLTPVTPAMNSAKLTEINTARPAAQPADDGRSISIVCTGIRPGEKLYEELSFDAESMRPTRHPDINIWLVPGADDAFVQRMTDSLAPGRRPDGPQLAERIHRLVREADGMPRALPNSTVELAPTRPVLTTPAPARRMPV
jgi:FlaA1/EpsC-like NDP-sugar epimerase